MGKYTKTVKEARSKIDRDPKITPVSWGQWRLKSVYGYTSTQVQNRLVTMNFCGKRIRVHRKVVDSLNAVEAQIRAIEKRNGYSAWVPDRVDTFNWRYVRGGSTLSHHSFGIALDIEPAENPYYHTYNTKITCNLPMRVINSFHNHGWTWGGRWDSPCDTMHFQRH